MTHTTNESIFRKFKYMDVKLCIMKTTEKIDYGFKSKLFFLHNPFLHFAKRIKQIDSRNFIVEWQMDENDKKEILEEQVYGLTT